MPKRCSGWLAGGKYEVQGVQPGKSYYFAAEKSGFLPDRKENIEIKDGIDPKVNFILKKGITLAGIVVNLQSQGIAGINVCESDYYGEKIFTAEDGSFEMKGLTPGKEISLAFLRQDNSPQTYEQKWNFISGKFVPSQEKAIFVLPMGGKVRAQLVDETGKGYSGKGLTAEISWKHNNSNVPNATECALFEFSLRGVNISSPLLEFPDLPLGDYTLELRSPTTARVDFPFTVSSQNITDLGNITIPTAFTAKALLLEAATGKPLSEHQSIEAIHQSGFGACLPENSQQSFYCSRPDSAGAITISNIPRGTKSIVLQSIVCNPVTIPLPEAQTGIVDVGSVKIDLLPQLSGTVINADGKPAVRATVMITYDTREFCDPRHGVSDASGKYLVAGLKPGAAKATVRLDSGPGMWNPQAPPAVIVPVVIGATTSNHLDIKLP